MQLLYFLHGPPLATPQAKGVSLVNDPSTYWLTFTNIGLGIVTLICCGAIAIGVLQELAARRKRKAAIAGLDREVNSLVHSFGPHTLDVPGLGLTMADGGEELKKKEER
jgi:hypothetical protein